MYKLIFLCLMLLFNRTRWYPFMKKIFPYNKAIAKIITIIIPILMIGLFIVKKHIIELIFRLPACPFYSIFHLYCPGCGNTRSFLALLNGHFPSSLRYNITIIVILILCLCAYIELASYSFWHHIRILPRKNLFYIIAALLIVAYTILRNFIPFLTQ